MAQMAARAPAAASARLSAAGEGPRRAGACSTFSSEPLSLPPRPAKHLLLSPTTRTAIHPRGAYAAAWTRQGPTAPLRVARPLRQRPRGELVDILGQPLGGGDPLQLRFHQRRELGPVAAERTEGLDQPGGDHRVEPIHRQHLVGEEAVAGAGWLVESRRIR